MEKALTYLDSIAVSALNVPEEPNLDGVPTGGSRISPHTRRRWAKHYRLVKLGAGAPAAYAMVINFGLGGRLRCASMRAEPGTMRWPRGSIILWKKIFSRQRP